jgi:probable F420-dependent oxidoreductase
MKIGAVFPQTEIGEDPFVIRDYIRSLEKMGFNHIAAFDHIIGERPKGPVNVEFVPYTHEHSFYEPLSLICHGAAITSRLKFMTGVLILPQRQTALVAKQAATIDVLSEGRLILGVGIGYNEYEYTALGVPFRARSARMEKQIEIMRALWANSLVNIREPDCTITDAGINPRPKTGMIQILVGAMADAGMQRAAKIGDGWISPHTNLDDIAGKMESMRKFLEQHGRRREDFTVSAIVLCRQFDKKSKKVAEEQMIANIQKWKEVGADSVAVDTTFIGLGKPDDHLELLEVAKNCFCDDTAFLSTKSTQSEATRGVAQI